MTYRSIEIEKRIPECAVINPNTNTCYMSYTSSDFIIVINLDKGTIENKIKVGHPRNIAVNNVTNKIYTASNNGVYEIDGINNEFVVINTGLHNSSGTISIDPVTNTVYSCFDSSNDLIVIDALTHSVRSNIAVGKTLRGAAVDSNDEKIYIPNYESESISVINYKYSNNAIDTISIKQRWDSNEIRNPSLVLLNENSNLLYVQTHVTHGHEGGAVEYEWLYLIYIPTKKTIKKMSLNSNAKVGFTYDPISNMICMRRTNSIIKFDAFGNNKKVLGKIDTEYTSIWKRLFGDGCDYLAEVIAVNPATNRIYVSDSKNNILYEIDG